MGAARLSRAKTSTEEGSPDSRGRDPLAPLAERAVEGDREAIRKLLTQLTPVVFRVVRAVLGPRGRDADDVTQEALLGFVRALPNFRGDALVSTYASRIAAKTAVSARRRAATRDARHEDLDAVAPQLVDRSAAPAEEAAATRRKELLRELLDQLPPEQAEVLALRIVLGCSRDEIAETTGVSENTVKSRLRLAKDALRRKIESDPKLAEALELSS